MVKLEISNLLSRVRFSLAAPFYVWCFMYEFLCDSNFIKAKCNNKHYYFGNVLLDVPSWDDVFLNLEKSLEENSFIRNMYGYGIVTHNGGTHIQKVKDFQTEIGKKEKHKNVTSHVYIALTKFFPSFDNHKDTSDVFFWQIIGKTKWIVTDNNVEFEYILSPGDVIFVPKDMYHKVISLGPRVGISIGLD